MKPAPHLPEFQIDGLATLIEEQDPKIQKLFAKALNLYVSPGADAALPKEKLKSPALRLD